MSRNLLVRWLVVCLIPLATLAVFVANPPEDKPQHLINGIILACEATFCLNSSFSTPSSII